MEYEEYKWLERIEQKLDMIMFIFRKLHPELFEEPKR